MVLDGDCLGLILETPDYPQALGRQQCSPRCSPSPQRVPSTQRSPSHTAPFLAPKYLPPSRYPGRPLLVPFLAANEALVRSSLGVLEAAPIRTSPPILPPPSPLRRVQLRVRTAQHEVTRVRGATDPVASATAAQRSQTYDAMEESGVQTTPQGHRWKMLRSKPTPGFVLSDCGKGSKQYTSDLQHRRNKLFHRK